MTQHFLLSSSGPKRVTEIDALVGRRVYELRKQRGLSQQKVAEAVGLTFGQVQKWEYGLNRVSAGHLWTLAQFFDVPIASFFVARDWVRLTPPRGER